MPHGGISRLLCAAFARAAGEDDAPAALKHAAVAVALTAARAAMAPRSCSRCARHSLRAHRGAMGACRAAAAMPARRRSKRRCASLHEELGLAPCRRREVLGMLDDYPTRSGYLITPVVVWTADSAAIRPNPEEVASVHRIALDDDRARRRLQLHRDSREHAPRDPLPPCRRSTSTRRRRR